MPPKKVPATKPAPKPSAKTPAATDKVAKGAGKKEVAASKATPEKPVPKRGRPKKQVPSTKPAGTEKKTKPKPKQKQKKVEEVEEAEESVEEEKEKTNGHIKPKSKTKPKKKKKTSAKIVLKETDTIKTDSLTGNPIIINTSYLEDLIQRSVGKFGTTPDFREFLAKFINHIGICIITESINATIEQLEARDLLNANRPADDYEPSKDLEWQVFIPEDCDYIKKLMQFIDDKKEDVLMRDAELNTINYSSVVQCIKDIKNNVSNAKITTEDGSELNGQKNEREKGKWMEELDKIQNIVAHQTEDLDNRMKKIKERQEENEKTRQKEYNEKKRKREEEKANAEEGSGDEVEVEVEEEVVQPKKKHKNKA